MVTLAVFSFGVLALAALMASGLKYNTSALHRSYATSQAYDIAERMRANRRGLDFEHYDQIVASSTVPNCVIFTEPVVNNCEIEINCDSNCDDEQMAQYDAWQWNCDNARLLPEGTGTVCRKHSDPDIYTITIYWNDDRDPDTPDVSFIVEFQPGGDDDGGSLAGEPDVPEEPKCIDAEGTDLNPYGNCISHWNTQGVHGHAAHAKCATCDE